MLRIDHKVKFVYLPEKIIVECKRLPVDVSIKKYLQELTDVFALWLLPNISHS